MMKINESSENYLESILILEQRNPVVRMSDIATLLQVSKPSVNKAMGVLKEAGYIRHDSSDAIGPRIRGKGVQPPCAVQAFLCRGARD